MSNFEDYDLRRSSGATRSARPTNRTSANRASGRPATGRPVSRSYGRDADISPDLSLDDEIDLYDYDLQSESMSARRPSGSRSASGSRPRSSASSHRTSAAAAHSSSAKRKKKPSSSHSSSRPTRNTSSSRGRNVPSGRKGSGRNGKKKKTRRTIIVVEIVVLLLLLLIFFFWNKFGKVNWDNINMDEIEVNNLDTETEELLSNYTTLALFGVDNRSNGNLDSGNSDTIILVSINNDTKEVKMVSVQRDTYLQITEGTYRKCNYAYNHGGVETAISMLNTNLDLKISGYVSVDFYALATIVDDLGGLELEITQKMIDTDNPETHQNALAGYIAEVENVLNYYPNEEDGWKYSDCYFDSPGTYTLNGAQVVGYCRNRYAVDNDYGRAENQRAVIKQIIEKAKKANVATLNDIANDVFPSISTSLSLSQVLSMAASVGDYEIADSTGFPFALKDTTISKTTGSVLVPCTLSSNVSQLHEFLYDQTDYDPTDDMVDVISDHIVNETGFTEDSATITQTTD
ncbi:MAG: LytR family transcriptional regulator [Pseudobutyrivibrio ruminis]|uniref:LCP family protein n=1 Tax=Pseudobutyrivibrio ruminis TaxID=46206 RepID=UPI0026F16D6C|nr:LCP family protein [Pseudobutyrivibrio ruminis]MBE5914636.1 LytR family transcriptional regulator [Pseudobutyrivibrio ruminis]